MSPKNRDACAGALVKAWVVLVLVASALAARGDAGVRALSTTGASFSAVPERTARLHHDPQFILQAVARRMGIALLPGIPVPTLLLESGTPLSRLQAAAEGQWAFRPHVFVTAFASAGNEIYLIDDAALYERRGGTLDDALAHELVHYLQAKYRKDTVATDWSESEAVAVQIWFRSEYMQPNPVAMLRTRSR